MPVFRKDPCGIICLMMTYLAVFYADFVVVRWIIIETLHSRFKPNLIVKLFDSLLIQFHSLVSIQLVGSISCCCIQYRSAAPDHGPPASSLL